MANLFFRAFVMVTLVAANTRQIAQGHYRGAFLCGAAISAVWYLNVGKACDDKRPAAVAAYALGAAVGTVTGMWLGR